MHMPIPFYKVRMGYVWRESNFLTSEGCEKSVFDLNLLLFSFSFYDWLRFKHYPVLLASSVVPGALGLYPTAPAAPYIPTTPTTP